MFEIFSDARFAQAAVFRLLVIARVIKPKMESRQKI